MHRICRALKITDPAPQLAAQPNPGDGILYVGVSRHTISSSHGDVKRQTSRLKHWIAGCDPTPRIGSRAKWKHDSQDPQQSSSTFDVWLARRRGNFCSSRCMATWLSQRGHNWDRNTDFVMLKCSGQVVILTYFELFWLVCFRLFARIKPWSSSKLFVLVWRHVTASGCSFLIEAEVFLQSNVSCTRRAFASGSRTPSALLGGRWSLRTMQLDGWGFWTILNRSEHIGVLWYTKIHQKNPKDTPRSTPVEFGHLMTSPNIRPAMLPWPGRHPMYAGMLVTMLGLGILQILGLWTPLDSFGPLPWIQSTSNHIACVVNLKQLNSTTWLYYSVVLTLMQTTSASTLWFTVYHLPKCWSPRRSNCDLFEHQEHLVGWHYVTSFHRLRGWICGSIGGTLSGSWISKWISARGPVNKITSKHWTARPRIDDFDANVSRHVRHVKHLWTVCWHFDNRRSIKVMSQNSCKSFTVTPMFPDPGMAGLCSKNAPLGLLGNRMT